MLSKPPDDLLRGHLELCPWCRETLELPMIPSPEPATPDSPKMPPIPGRLYTLSPKLAGWGPKSRYYNPPVVLILSCPDEHSVFVCQTYSDLGFAGPDDILLGDVFTGFAQPWNCYTLMQNNLETSLGDIDLQIVEMVRQRIDQDMFSPQPGSLFWFFRQMEVETGYYFSSMAVAFLMAKYESNLISLLIETDSSKIVQDLQHLPIRLATNELAEISPIDVLFWAEPDPQQLPLAAADTETTPALVFLLKNGKIEAAEALPISISFCEYANGRMVMTGSAAFTSPGGRNWLFRWQTADSLIEPLPEHSGYDGTLFWVTFSLTPDQAAPPGRLIVRLLQEDQD